MTRRKSERNQKWQIKAAKHRNRDYFPQHVDIFIRQSVNYKMALKLSYVPNNYMFTSFKTDVKCKIKTIMLG